MISKDIHATEQLYRAVKRSRPDCLDRNNRPTAAMFKDTDGVSVDRDGGRKDAECIKFMCEVTFPKRVKGVARLSALECLNAGTEVKAAPTSTNPYHANIFLDSSDIRRQNIQALKLARASSLIFLDKFKEWRQ